MPYLPTTLICYSIGKLHGKVNTIGYNMKVEYDTILYVASVVHHHHTPAIRVSRVSTKSVPISQSTSTLKHMAMIYFPIIK